MKAEEVMDDRLGLFFFIVLASAFLSAWFDLSGAFMDLAVDLAVGLILGGIAATIVIGFSGEALENIEIGVYGLSISGFTVATFIVRHVLF